MILILKVFKIHRHRDKFLKIVDYFAHYNPGISSPKCIKIYPKCYCMYSSTKHDPTLFSWLLCIQNVILAIFLDTDNSEENNVGYTQKYVS